MCDWLAFNGGHAPIIALPVAAGAEHADAAYVSKPRHRVVERPDPRSVIVTCYRQGGGGMNQVCLSYHALGYHAARCAGARVGLAYPKEEPLLSPDPSRGLGEGRTPASPSKHARTNMPEQTCPIKHARANIQCGQHFKILVSDV